MLLACFCLGGVWLNEGKESKNFCSWSTKQIQFHQEQRPCDSILSQQKTLPPVYIIRPLSLKQDTFLLKCKKVLTQIFSLFSLINESLTIHLSDYSLSTCSYQFSRLNVLSSQAHPPTRA